MRSRSPILLALVCLAALVVAGCGGSRSKPEKGTIGLDLTIAGLNERQAIGAPAAARPIGDLTAALQQVLAQAQAHGGGTAGPGSSSSTQPKYDACVQAAGSDIAKAQECASLLGQ